MPLLRLALAATIALSAASAFAQNPPSTSVRATIESVSTDGASLTVRTRAGEQKTIRLSAKTRVILVVPASLSEVKKGDFIGVAALPGEGGELKAIEVHIFPEAMRGTGEGFRKYDLASNQLDDQRQCRGQGRTEWTGPKLTVTYKGGEQTIVIGPTTPVVAFAPGARDDLKPEAAIIARGSRQDDGSVDAVAILVGKDGLVPPM